MTSSKTILMVAAENDALPDAKVGGIGDVVRDLPVALAEQHCRVHVIVPSYGFLHEAEAAQQVAHFPVFFANNIEHVNLYRIPQAATRNGADDAVNDRVTQWVVHHPAFAPCGPKRVYCNDSDDRPFATDANKFALFGAAVGQAILNSWFGELDVLHLHDWHTAVLAVLREYDPHYAQLQSLHTVYSIHNLALQGVRPFEGDASALRSWFPQLQFDRQRICDPNIPHCFNPMRAAIELADKVHAVSPTYAVEIQSSSDRKNGVYGGEGLEAHLRNAAQQQRLHGILNGCEYPAGVPYQKLSKAALASSMQEAVIQWASRTPLLLSAHWLANLRLQSWQSKKERGFVVTSVGRITEQKVRILKFIVQCHGKRQSVLQHLLDQLKHKGVFVLLGSGDDNYQNFFTEVAGKNEHFIYLQGYSDALSQALYKSGDLFMMPSSFEPCGISQMLAMRAGQPCLVHGVGGLKDTVQDGVDGFVFAGENDEIQGQNMLKRFEQILLMAEQNPKDYSAIGKRAHCARFTWTAAAKEYLALLYQ